MPVGRHQRLELAEAGDVAHALVLDVQLHVEFLRQREQLVDGPTQIVHAIAVVGQIAEDAQVARAQHLGGLEGLGVDHAWRPVAELEAELVALGLRRLAGRAPLQERCANARHGEAGGPRALRRSGQLVA